MQFLFYLSMACVMAVNVTDVPQDRRLVIDPLPFPPVLHPTIRIPIDPPTPFHWHPTIHRSSQPTPAPTWYPWTLPPSVHFHVPTPEPVSRCPVGAILHPEYYCAPPYSLGCPEPSECVYCGGYYSCCEFLRIPNPPIRVPLPYPFPQPQYPGPEYPQWQPEYP
jgi:hypothetical protein